MHGEAPERSKAGRPELPAGYLSVPKLVPIINASFPKDCSIDTYNVNLTDVEKLAPELGELFGVKHRGAIRAYSPENALKLAQMTVERALIRSREVSNAGHTISSVGKRARGSNSFVFLLNELRQGKKPDVPLAEKLEAIRDAWITDIAQKLTH